MVDLAKIEERIDRTESSAIAVSETLGGIQLSNMVQVMELAKMLAISKEAVPQHLRGEPGICLAVCIQALEWRMSPFAVANKSYVVNGRLSYESQLIHAVIEQRAPLQGRLRHRYEGEGDERICIVWATAKGEKEPFEYRTPPTSKITPKNSPLWKSKPDVQLYYVASRDWARIYFPDVLLGIYSEDELRDTAGGPEFARDITPPDLKERLKRGRKGTTRGFDKDHVDATLPPAQPNIEQELENKRAALSSCETAEEIEAIAAGVTEFLTASNRPDLLAAFLPDVETRKQQIAKAT